MAVFTVNGKTVTAEKNQKLLRFLRDELRLTSVKDGCSEGACGTCTVLIDGKPTKACVPQTEKLEGKTIVTVEGLSDWEKQVYVFAFGEAGAVQCGFCIPGMVIAGKALLDQNPTPTEAEIKKAIRGNVCRCTGYKKIIEGIALAGAILRGEASVDPALEEGEDYGVGARAFRTDVRDKVLGRGEYCDDLLGQYINLYYGSFAALLPEEDEEGWKDELFATVAHEFTHHMEETAGLHALDDKDAEFLRQAREIYGDT